MRPRPDSAVTLFELVVALTIVVSVLAMVVPIFVGASRSAGVQTGVDVADRNASRLLADLRSDLRSAQVLGLASPSSMPAITYRVPATGEDVDEDGDILWSPPRTLSFDVVQTIDEDAENIDLNGDGDRKDRFVRCRLLETVDGGSDRTVSGSTFVLDADSPQGDVDGDGKSDAPFRSIPGGLRIVLWSLIRPDVTGLRRAQVDIMLRNPQVEGGSGVFETVG